MTKLKLNDLKVEQYPSTKSNGYWAVSEFQGYLELFPGMKSETWKRVSPKFDTKQQAQAWKTRNSRVSNALTSEAQ